MKEKVMRPKTWTVVPSEVKSRHSSGRYALVSINQPRAPDQEPSFNYGVFRDCYDHAGCAALEHSTKSRISPSALLAALFCVGSPEEVFITEDAYPFLEQVVNAVLTFRPAELAA